MAYPTQGGTQNVYVNEIKNGQAVNDFYFLKDGKFKQISDMSGSGTLSTYEGTWKITGTNLTITLLIKGMQIDANYTCEQKGDVLILTLVGPDKLMVNVSTFRKK
jgi:hypothetical protein